MGIAISVVRFVIIMKMNHKTSKKTIIINEKALSQVTGKYKVLEVINSGSFCELELLHNTDYGVVAK